jgi:dihydrofolate reductase
MQIKTHVGVSIDGLVTSADGLPAWDWDPGHDGKSPPPGYSDFMDNVGAVVMGRTTFEQGLPDWKNAWPWGERPIRVLTHRPLPDGAPPTVKASNGGPKAVVDELKKSGTTNDVQLLGGPKAIQSFIHADLLDRLGIVVLPVLLESGIPLFPVKATEFSREVWDKSSHKPAKDTVRTMRLESQKQLEGRAVHMVYAFT